MNDLLSNPAFKAYALSTVVLSLNMLGVGVYTAVQRGKNQAFANAEDKKGAVEQAAEHPKVARGLRAHRNAIESILPYFALGLVYVLSGATARGAMAYFGAFTAARVLHSIVYILEKQPWRTIFFAIGVLCLLGMMVQIVMKVM